MNLLKILMPFIAGLMGAMGLGSGTVLLLYLTFLEGVDQLSAQGINLMFFIPTAAVSLSIFLFKKQIKLKPLLPFIAFGLPFCLLGFLSSDLLGEQNCAKLFGLLLIFIGLKDLFFKNNNKNR